MLSWPEPGEFAGLQSIATLAVVALFYGAAALRWRAPYLLYPALLFATGGYGLALDRLQPQHLGLAMLPGSAVSLALGWLLYWRLEGRRPSYASRGDPLSPASPLAWATPLLAAGYAGTLAAVAISLPNEGPRMATLLFAAGVSGLSLAIFQGRAWLYSLLVFAHGAYASALALQRLHLDGPEIGVLFVPATVAMALGMAITLRKSAGKASRQDILTSWTLPFAIACLADAAISLFLAAQSDATGLLVTATYAILTAAGAQLTQNRFLPYVSTGFTTAAVIFTSRLLGLSWSQSAIVWSVQGLLMWWGGQAAASRRERPSDLLSGLPSKLAIWAMPLRKAGVRLSWFAAAFVLGIVAFSLLEPGSLEGGRLLLGVKVLTGEPMQNATAVLAFLGLLYLGMAFVERRPVFAYLLHWGCLVADR